jgi:hypothetical protein
MSFKFGISLIGLHEDCPRGCNPKNKDSVFLKPSWVANKELDRMDVVGLGLLTYDSKST